MKIAIVEDEYMVAKRLKRFVEQACKGKTYQINVFNTLADADEYLSEQTIDILFLDLNLQGQDGFELLKQQVSRSFHTIIVSANTHRAIEAFEIGVLDFIAKPFNFERVQKALQRTQLSESRGKSQFLSYKKLGKIELLPIEQILYLKASGHYCEVITTTGEIILHDKSLERLLLVLPDSFIRIQRSYAVPPQSMQSIKSEEGSKYWLTLTNDEVLPIGRTRIKEVKAKLI